MIQQRSMIYSEELLYGRKWWGLRTLKNRTFHDQGVQNVTVSSRWVIFLELFSFPWFCQRENSGFNVKPSCFRNQHQEKERKGICSFCSAVCSFHSDADSSVAFVWFQTKVYSVLDHDEEESSVWGRPGWRGEVFRRWSVGDERRFADVAPHQSNQIKKM